MKETFAYLNSLLKNDDTIIIGLSGGADSMCLLNIVLSLPKKVNVICAHINHNIRQESFQEMEFLKEYCHNKNVLIETTIFPKKSSTSNFNELELREMRYQYFEELVTKYKASYLFTAHHGDDLVETILMRISRGSNLKGYSGFQVETPKKNYKIIKPLIYTTKEMITEYNHENNIPFVTDKTNEEDKYTRNRYRHHILPFLKKENSNIHLKYLKFSRELIKYYNYVDKIVNTELNKRYHNKKLNIENFSNLDELIQTKIIEKILDDNYEKNLYLVNDRHIDLILDLIKSNRPNIEINLPDNLLILKSYNEVKITRKQSSMTNYHILVTDNTILPNGKSITRITTNAKNTNDYIKLNSKEIYLPLYVRTRINGDKMIVKNMKEPKKIKDIYINSKLSKEERDNQPIVVDSKDQIVWLPGLKKSKFDKANTENYDIILWYN